VTKSRYSAPLPLLQTPRLFMPLLRILQEERKMINNTRTMITLCIVEFSVLVFLFPTVPPILVSLLQILWESWRDYYDEFDKKLSRQKR